MQCKFLRSVNVLQGRYCLLTRCLWLALFSGLFIANANASSIKQVNLNQLIEQSEFVFEGRVVSSDPRWNDAKTLIKTFITFEVDEVIAGDYQQSTLELSFVGGTIGKDNVEAEGLRQPVVGEKGIYFVHSLTRNLVNPLVGWSQGQFLLEKDNQGNDVVMTDSHHPVIGLSANTKNSVSVATRSEPLSEGVASDVIVSKEKSANDSAMNAIEFKKALKARMQSLKK